MDGMAHAYSHTHVAHHQAIRRNLSNIAAKDLGSVLLQDISHQSVPRHEVETGAALQAGIRNWHAEAEALCKSDLHSLHNLPIVSSHSLSQDATTSNVWQRSKLQNLKCVISYTYSRSEVNTAADFLRLSHTSEPRFADVQRVGSGSGATSYALMLKQLASVGCPIWQITNQPPRDGPAANNFVGERVPDHIRLFFITTDGAGDQVMSRKVASVLYVLV
jgi:hypothetical protein